MKITFTPQRRDGHLRVSVSGDTLTINGTAYDLSGVPEGGRLPGSAVLPGVIFGDIQRIGGVLQVALSLPYSNDDETDPFAVIEVDVEEGPAGPQQEAPEGYEPVPAAIDWGALTPPPGPPSPAELFAQAVDYTQKRLDDFAASRGYDGILSLCTYATDPDPVYSAEGQRGVTLRSTTWATLRNLQREILAGQRPLPSSWEELDGLLPPLTWEAESAN